jgi:hydrogenase nickel incorporation protein HypA/HybF
VHEFSLVASLADTVRRHLPPDGRLVAARVSVGALEHLDPLLMQTAWEGVLGEHPLAPPKPPGPATGPTDLPRLELVREEVSVECRNCRATYTPPDLAWMVCPECGRARPRVLAGVGVTLLSLEVETPATAISRTLNHQDVS